MVKGTCQGSTIVEMAYLMPVILLMWVLIIYGIFLFHDKVILSGAAYETAVVGSEYAHEDEISEGMLIQYFQDRVDGKLLFFSEVTAQAEIEEDQITVSSQASRKGMGVSVIQRAPITFPEKEIRKIRMIKDGLEGVFE